MRIDVRRNGEIVGSLMLKKTSDGDLFIESMRVHPEFRGQKLGSSLLEKAIKSARKQGRNLVALIDPDGTGLSIEQEIEMFKRRGFEFAKHNLGNDNFKNVMILLNIP